MLHFDGFCQENLYQQDVLSRSKLTAENINIQVDGL